MVHIDKRHEQTPRVPLEELVDFLNSQTGLHDDNAVALARCEPRTPAELEEWRAAADKLSGRGAAISDLTDFIVEKSVTLAGFFNSPEEFLEKTKSSHTDDGEPTDDK